MLDVLLDALLDTAKLIPFLFLAYLMLELIEHHASKKAKDFTAKAGHLGPLVGSLLGVVPQCGFSASASNLYSGGVISLGTLIAIFLSTSDEMLPVMLSEGADISRILPLLAIKVGCGILIGFGVDLVLRFLKKAPAERSISRLCEEEHCHCGNGGVIRSALLHTGEISLFIFLFSFGIGTILFFVGEESLAAFAASKSILVPILAALVGLIPNCASSVILTELFLDGVISTGAVVAGLLAGSGVGLLILFRINKRMKENLAITAVIYLSGTAVGILLDLLGVVI